MEFRDIEGYENMYQISDSGVVRSLDRFVDLPNGKKRFAKGKLLKLGINNKGYVDVRLNKKGIAKNHYINRLVASAFIPNPNNLPFTNHLDGNPQNNNVENLEWTDASGNSLHAYRTGLNSNCGATHIFAVPIIDIRTGDIYCTIKAFCEHFGINYNTGCGVLNGYRQFPKTIDLAKHWFRKYSC